MSLENLRQKVIFQNSIDVWIESCSEAGRNWLDTQGYMKFIAYLRDRNLNLRAFNLCAHEAGAVEKEKTDFAESLRNIGEPNAATYTIKLSDSAIDAVREFHSGQKAA